MPHNEKRTVGQDGAPVKINEIITKDQLTLNSTNNPDYRLLMSFYVLQGRNLSRYSSWIHLKFSRLRQTEPLLRIEFYDFISTLSL